MSEKNKVTAKAMDMGINTIVVQLLQGTRYGWPLYQLSSWKLSPVVKGDELRLTIGETLIIIEGFKLLQIVQVLEKGIGYEITEQGERFAATQPAGELYVKTIKVIEPEEEPS